MMLHTRYYNFPQSYGVDIAIVDLVEDILFAISSQHLTIPPHFLLPDFLTSASLTLIFTTILLLTVRIPSTLTISIVFIWFEGGGFVKSRSERGRGEKSSSLLAKLPKSKARIW